RDLKPDNILLHSDGSAVISDFGIARALSGYVASTGVNMTIGTPQYLSPEQAQGRPLDARLDFYALGVTLFKAATGEVPISSSDGSSWPGSPWGPRRRRCARNGPSPPSGSSGEWWKSSPSIP